MKNMGKMFKVRKRKDVKVIPVWFTGRHRDR